MGLNGDWKKEGYKIRIRASRSNEPGSFKVYYISAYSKSGRKVGSTEILEDENKRYATPHSTKVKLRHQRKGLALAMYSFYEKSRKVSLRPDEDQSESAIELWKTKLKIQASL